MKNISLELTGRLLGIAWRKRWGCLKVIAMHVLTIQGNLVTLHLLGLAIDSVRHHSDNSVPAPHWHFDLDPTVGLPPLQQTGLIVALSLLAAAVTAGLQYFAMRWKVEVVESVLRELRHRVYDKMQQLGPSFYQKHSSASLINRATSDVAGLNMFLGDVVLQSIQVSMSIFLFGLYMLYIHVPLTMACLASTPIIALLAVSFSRWVYAQYRLSRGLGDQLVLNLSEFIQGIHVVKSFSREEQQSKIFNKGNDELYGQNRLIFGRVSGFNARVSFLVEFSKGILLLFGGWLVLRGHLSLGQGFVVFSGLLQQVTLQVTLIVNILDGVQNSLAGAQRIFEVLDSKPGVEAPKNGKNLDRLRGHLSFENVTFGYREGVPILEDISFEVHPGQTVAIIGATGSGKSALLELVLRFYDPWKGSIRIDGIDLRDMDPDELRLRIGIVFQENFLFSNTVRANIAYANPGAGMEEVEKVAKIASAHEFITGLPEGYQTIVGERGVGLSGGQRQRIAIARALLKNPSILLLDDPTAAIDAETEAEIIEAMQRAQAQRTSLVVAHRLSTLRQADRILVLDRGRLVQQGTHAELQQIEGVYREVASSQEFAEMRPA